MWIEILNSRVFVSSLLRFRKLLILCTFYPCLVFAQTNPVITRWLQNTTTTGYYYVSGNSTPISNGILVNCQEVSYSANWGYVKTKGIPAYKVGPYLDGNPSQAGNQNAIFKFPLNPTQNTGTPTATTGGNIGVFINGVAMFDDRDGVSWRNSTGTLCGGLIMPACVGDSVWNRDAVLAERAGFDCAKGHPAGTNYHHHQNPSAFKLDLLILSTICNLYDSDGLYTINSAIHSPLIVFAYDGFPVYGAYGYANADGTGGITRIKSGYQLRNILFRTHYADGTDVVDGPPVNATYPLGYFREDYEWISHPGDESYLDVHNGRFCITPEYPSGKYCYFATVNTTHNSAYPYMIGPTFYGNKTAAKVSDMTESVTIYSPPLPISLLNLIGKIDHDDGIFTWTSRSETNVKQFIIQRSIDGLHFENLVIIKSVGDNLQNSTYQYIDKNIPKGLSYYKLQQVDIDGRIQDYDIISLSNNVDRNGFSVLYIQASDLITIQYNNGVLEYDTDVILLDKGEKVILKTRMNKGQTIAFFNVEMLYSGSYTVSLRNNTMLENVTVNIGK